MKRILACLVILAMVAAMLVGCKPTQEEMLQGSWKGTADLAMAYETMLAGADPAMTGHIDIKSFTVELTLKFHEDGTYSWEVNEDHLRIGTANMKDAFAKGLATYLEIETGESMDDLLRVSGMTMDELMATYFDPDMEGVVRRMLCSSGTYELDRDTLTLVDQTRFVIFEGEISVTEDKLSLKNGVGSELVTHLVPMTFSKVQ